MKKIICIVVIVVLCCLQCSCDPNSISPGRMDLLGVVSVELIEYDNPKQKQFMSWVPDQFFRLVPFDVDNVTVLETLPEEQITAFLDEFSDTEILDTYYAYNSPKDICIRLTYDTGSFLIIWANYSEKSHAGYIGKYSAEGEVQSFLGSFCSLEDYENLVDDFFTHGLT